MFRVWGALLAAGLMLSLVGCEPRKIPEYDGPTVSKFTGKVVHEGKPVEFSDEESVTLNLLLKKGRRQFGVPLRKDGSFELGWMPIGRYAVLLDRMPKAGGMRLSRIPVTDNFEIEDGKTDYVIELGPLYKP